MFSGTAADRTYNCLVKALYIPALLSIDTLQTEGSTPVECEGDEVYDSQIMREAAVLEIIRT
jgi:hypothetical protein